MKDLGMQIMEVISSLKQHAVRREAIYERINAEQSAELDKKREKVGQYLSLFFLYFSVFSVFFSLGGPVRRREEDGGLEEQHQEADPADQGHSENV